MGYPSTRRGGGLPPSETSRSVTFGVAFTDPGSLNTKGAWTELVASSAGGDGLVVSGICYNQTLTDRLVDIGTGGAGSEQVLIPDLYVPQGSDTISLGPMFFPIPIPAGTRIAGRFARSAASAKFAAHVHTFREPFSTNPPFSLLDAHGVNAAQSRGQTIDPGGTANVKGAWTAVTNSTARDHRGLYIAIGRDTTISNGTRWLVDIGTGGAGSEVAIVSDIACGAAPALDYVSAPFIGPIYVDIPAGSRLSARAQCDSTTSADRQFYIVLYGLG